MPTDQNPVSPPPADDYARFEEWYQERKAADDRKARLDKTIPADVREALGEIIDERLKSFAADLFGPDEGDGGDDTSSRRPRPEGDTGSPAGILRLLGIDRKAAGE